LKPLLDLSALVDRRSYSERLAVQTPLARLFFLPILMIFKTLRPGCVTVRRNRTVEQECYESWPVSGFK